ncbi:MAG: sugar O-acyltransferase, sialic acid O-acetyltransferase NeuD family [Crocinitomicaceae bacterium]|jgi:sugar O-acyltransferase (sialic acid O-acetyltransferase NeuD family)|nr:sugar O-acyltransferase, sialic acid O-acetyltransferase NeuD family [Crocinitomicaceae bacterium]
MPGKNKIAFIGYSGHAYVCMDVARTNGFEIEGYCDSEEKKNNPFDLKYLGVEDDFFCHTPMLGAFVAIGSNALREKIVHKFPKQGFVNLVHPSAVISATASVTADANTLINPNVSINALAQIGRGVILNTNCTIEHECIIGDFAHIAPGAVLAGNVSVGKRTFVGANSVVKQGVRIGNDVTIGAGTVIINDIEDGATVVGNPGKIIKKHNL